MRITVVWFRRDLRLSDNPAWIRGCRESDRVLPVFVHDPASEGEWAPGAASRWWLHRSLEALDAALRARGSRLIVLRGDAGEAIAGLAREQGAHAVYWNRLYEPAIVKRDRDIKQRLRESGIGAESHNAALLFEPWTVSTGRGEPYRVFTPFWRACRERLEDVRPERAPGRVPSLPASAPRGEKLAALELLPRVRWYAGFEKAWRPGEHGAGLALRRFSQNRLAEYGRLRDRPALDGTSGLSPHLHFGEIGPRQVAASIRRSEGHGGRDEGARLFLAELGWREFAHHLLFHFPKTPDEPLDPRFRRFPWAREPSVSVDAWRRGRTGIPMVDAGMRQLWAAGWMHNRVRMIVASFLTKNLLVPWQEGARWFWDTLVDADLANNTLGWQWTAGCGADAAPFFRIFNPVLQGERFDPEGDYVRRWVPELRQVPGARVHAPWRVADPPGDYPAPIVDLKASRRRALAAFDRIKSARGG